MKKIRTIFVIVAAFVLCLSGFVAFRQRVQTNVEAADYTESELASIEAAMFDSKGLIINGRDFEFEGYKYVNYMAGYTKSKTVNGELQFRKTTIGKSIELSNGALKETLIDLSQRTDRNLGGGFQFLPGTAAGFTLPLNYNLKEINDAFVSKYRELIGSGYNLGVTGSGVFTWFGNIVQWFKHGQSTCDWTKATNFVGYGWSALIYNDATKECYLYSDYIAQQFVSSQTHSAGTPLGDSFIVSGVSGINAGARTIVQNFSHGYIHSRINSESSPGVVTSASVGVFVPYQNVTVIDTNTTVASIKDGNLAGQVGIVIDKYNDHNNKDRNFAGSLIRNRYEALIEEGNYPGLTRSFASEVQGVLMQVYQSNTTTFSNSEVGVQMRAGNTIGFVGASGQGFSLIAYNAVMERAFVVKNQILTSYGRDDYPSSSPNFQLCMNVRALGAPIEEERIIGTRIYQNFERGYIRFLGSSTLTNDTVVIGKHFTDREVDLQDYDFKGIISDSAVIPANVTKDHISSLFSQKLDEIRIFYQDLKTVSPIKGLFNLGLGSTMQILQYVPAGASEPVKMALSYNAATDRINLLDNEFFSEYTGKEYLGAVTFERRTLKANHFRVIFENGYIELENGKFTTKAGFSYNAAMDSFTSQNYIDNVGHIGQVPNRDPIRNATPGFYSGVRFTYEDITAAIRKVYTDYMEAGYNIGIPDDAGVLWWRTGGFGVIVQKFAGGDSTGKDADGFSQMIAYDPSQKAAFLVTGTIYSEYYKSIPMLVGVPVDEQRMAADGTLYQAFYSPIFEDYYYSISPDGFIRYDFGTFQETDYDNNSNNNNNDNKSKIGCNSSAFIASGQLTDTIFGVLSLASVLFLLIISKRRNINGNKG